MNNSSKLFLILIYFNISAILINLTVYLISLPDKVNHIAQFGVMVLVLFLIGFQSYHIHKNIRAGRFSTRRGHIFLVLATILGLFSLVGVSMFFYLVPIINLTGYFLIISCLLLIGANLIYFMIIVGKLLIKKFVP